MEAGCKGLGRAWAAPPAASVLSSSRRGALSTHLPSPTPPQRDSTLPPTTTAGPSTSPARAMARGPGGSGGATLQRSKLNLTQKVRQVEPKLDQSGGDGGIGKGIFNGGGGGDDGGDDDDDYFADGEGDGEGDGASNFLRSVIKQLYDAPSLEAVLAEWGRTAADLPAILRQSVAMGLFSSAQLVRFLAMDVRPGLTRSLTRNLPPAAARSVVGRLMADPAFVQKAVAEQLLTAALSLRYEAAARGDRFWTEFDYVMLNTVSLCAANAAAVWCLAPSRAAPAGRPFAAALSGVPNHAFDAGGPGRAFSRSGRAASLLARGAELAVAGGAAGAVMSGGGAALAALRRRVGGDATFQPASPVPSPATALGMAAAAGVFTNARHQALGGVDRWLFDHAASLTGYLSLSTAVRGVGAAVSHGMRLHVQGLPKIAEILKERAAAAPVRRRRRRVARAAVPAAAVAADATTAAAADVPLPALRRTRKKKARRATGFEMSAAAA